jgi:hypothetical protein
MFTGAISRSRRLVELESTEGGKCARFPPPWTVEATDGGFKIVDANGQAIAYVYGHADPRDAGIAKALTLDEARRIAGTSPSCQSCLARARWLRPRTGARGCLFGCHNYVFPHKELTKRLPVIFLHRISRKEHPQ